MLATNAGRIRTDIKYIKGHDNDAEDALSRLPLISSYVTNSNITREHLYESCCVDKLDSDILPLTYQTIYKYQHKDKNLVEIIKCANCHTKYFCGGGNTFMFICKNAKCFVPIIFQNYVVN